MGKIWLAILGFFKGLFRHQPVLLEQPKPLDVIPPMPIVVQKVEEARPSFVTVLRRGSEGAPSPSAVMPAIGVYYKPHNIHVLSSVDGKTQSHLIHGWNSVPGHVWDQNKGNPEIQGLIATGALKFFKGVT